jgi:cytochrome c biogenesis protein CcdA/glutaredoxin
MKKTIFFIIICLVFLPFLALAQENNNLNSVNAPLYKTNVVYFYSLTCPHCKNVKPYLDKWEKQYKDEVKVIRYEITGSQKNRNLYYNFLDSYGIPRGEGGIPIVFIGDKYFEGDQPIIDNLEAKIQACQKNSCFLKNNLDEEIGGLKEIGISGRSKVTLGLVLGAGLIDSINPCAIGVLLFLIAFIIAIRGTKKRMLIIGFIYIFAVFLSYYLAGLGLLKIIAVFDIATIIRWIAAGILIVAGVISLKSVFGKEGGISLKIPDRAKPTIERFLKRATIPAVFVAGFLVSAFEFPCTGEVYLGILSAMANEQNKLGGYLYLLLYNLIFVLPLIVILILAALGLNVQRIEKVRLEKRKWVRLILGLLMIGLALWLILY